MQKLLFLHTSMTTSKMSSYQDLIGEMLLELRAKHPKKSFAELADMIDYKSLPKPKTFDTSLGQMTAAAYRRALEQKGDRYSLQMIRKLDGEEIGEDPSGN